MHHFGEAKDHEVQVLHSRGGQEANSGRPTAKEFDVVLTGDHGAVSDLSMGYWR
jgi:hypothetical protein